MLYKQSYSLNSIKRGAGVPELIARGNHCSPLKSHVPITHQLGSGGDTQLAPDPQHSVPAKGQAGPPGWQQIPRRGQGLPGVWGLMGTQQPAQAGTNAAVPMKPPHEQHPESGWGSTARPEHGAAWAAAPAAAVAVPTAFGQHPPLVSATAIRFYRNQAERGLSRGTHCHPTGTVTTRTTTARNKERNACELTALTCHHWK